MKIRIDKRDQIFSKIIRLRARWCCEKCGRFFPKGHGLQCAHIFGRRHRSTRFHPDNAVALCYTDHMYFTENPTLFTAWVKSYLGDVRYEELEARHRQIVKRTKTELEELYRHLKAQLKALEEDPNYRVVAYD